MVCAYLIPIRSISAPSSPICNDKEKALILITWSLVGHSRDCPTQLGFLTSVSLQVTDFMLMDFNILD